MKNGKRRKGGKGGAATLNSKERPEKASVAPKPSGGVKAWHLAAGLFLVLFVLFEMYSPAINGPFLFDDKYLPFTHPVYKDLPLSSWLIGVRPTLMFSFWLNYQFSAENPFSYHVLNVLLHFFNGILVFMIVRRILEWVDVELWRREFLGAFAGCIFLFHPLQSEAVAYVASRSENLSVFFFYAAFTVFLYRRSKSVSLTASLLILVLFGAAVTSKEHTAVLPFLLVLTDYFFNPGFSFGGIKRNWRLYTPVAVAGALGFAFVLSKLAESDTAGFRVEGLPWYLYFITQCKVIWIYVRLLLLPVGQNVDHEYPMVSSVADPLGLAGMAALIALVVAAWLYRRRFPVVAYGIFVSLLLLAPTSSVVPIMDALVERRLYLPMVGFLLVAAGLLSRWRTQPRTLAAALAVGVIVCAMLGFGRARVWAGSIPLWEDSVKKKPDNWRASFQLAYAYFENQRCSDAVEEYARTAELEKPDYRLLVDWALAYDCAGRPADALVKFEQAAALEKTAHVYSMIGMIHGKQGQYKEALEALETAEKLDQNFMMIYFYRGNVHASRNDHAGAAQEYRRALNLDPDFEPALRALQRSEQIAGGAQ